MIAYKSISVEKSDELNKFLKKNPAIGDKEKGDSGINLHHGYFIVRYEDGTPIDEKSLRKTNIHQALNVNRSNIVIAGIQSQTTAKELRSMIPDLTIDEIISKNRDYFVKFFQDKGLSYKQAGELTNGIEKSIDQMKMDLVTVDRVSKVNIPILESLLESN